jgi:hypothetical protein
MKSCCANLLYVMAILSFVLFVCLPFPCKFTSTCCLLINLYVCVLSPDVLMKKKSPIGSLALSKTGDTQTYQNSPTNKKLKGFLVRNTLVPPETKFTITFCANYTCDGNRDCYCCLHDGNDVCYWTRADCQAECPACAPHCPP